MIRQGIIIVVAILVTAFVIKTIEREPKDWTRQFNEQQHQIEQNRDAYKLIGVKLDTIYSRLDQKYVEIDSANKPDLRHLFDDFKHRTN